MGPSEYVKVLEELNASLNDGRGVIVLDFALYYLRKGDVGSAKVVLLPDVGKLLCYEGVVERLIEIGLLPPLLPSSLLRD